MLQDSKENSATLKIKEIRCVACKRLLFVIAENLITAGILRIELKCRCLVVNQITCEPIAAKVYSA